MAADPGAFRRQDTVIIAKSGPFPEAHPEWRWRLRAPDEYEDLDVRVAWREAEPVDPAVASDAADGGVARYHADSGMVLVARWGILQTVLVADHLPDDLRDQLG